MGEGKQTNPEFQIPVKTPESSGETNSRSLTVRVTQTLPYIIYNKDLGILHPHLANEIADIVDRKQFGHDMLMLIERLPDLSPEERMALITDIGDLVTKVNRFATVEAKLASSAETLWDQLQKTLMEYVPCWFGRPNNKNADLIRQLTVVRDNLATIAKAENERRAEEARKAEELSVAEAEKRKRSIEEKQLDEIHANLFENDKKYRDMVENHWHNGERIAEINRNIDLITRIYNNFVKQNTYTMDDIMHEAIKEILDSLGVTDQNIESTLFDRAYLNMSRRNTIVYKAVDEGKAIISYAEKIIQKLKGMNSSIQEVVSHRRSEEYIKKYGEKPRWDF